MISIPAALIEFVEGGNTIWVHGPMGTTILRIKTMGKINVNGECENICSHSDIVVKDDIEMCLSDDAKPVTDLERLKDTFDKIGVPYVAIIEDGYTDIYTCSPEEQKAGKLDQSSHNYTLFEFCENGAKVVVPPRLQQSSIALPQSSMK